MSDTQSYFDNVIGTSFWSLNSNGVQLLCGTYISLLRVKNRFLLSQTGLCIHHACIFLLFAPCLSQPSCLHRLTFAPCLIHNPPFFFEVVLHPSCSYLLVVAPCLLQSPFCLAIGWCILRGRTYLLLHHVSHYNPPSFAWLVHPLRLLASLHVVWW